jgi:hypothetical protein
VTLLPTPSSGSFVTTSRRFLLAGLRSSCSKLIYTTAATSRYGWTIWRETEMFGCDFSSAAAAGWCSTLGRYVITVQ